MKVKKLISILCFFALPHIVIIASAGIYIQVSLINELSKQKFIYRDVGQFKVVFIITLCCWFMIFIQHLQWVGRGKQFGLFTFLEKFEIPEEETSAFKKSMYPEIPGTYLSDLPRDFVVGKKGSQYIYMPVRSDGLNAVCVAEPGSGKSVSLLGWILTVMNLEQIYKYKKTDLSGIRRWNFFLVDVDGLLYRKFLRCGDSYDAELDDSDVKVVELNNRLSYGFDVLYRVHQDKVSETDKLKTVQDIADAMVEESGDNPYFSGNAKKILTGVLLWGINRDMEFVDIIQKLLRSNLSNLLKEVTDDARKMGEGIILDKLQGFVGTDDNESVKDIETTMKQYLEVFSYPDVTYALKSNPNRINPSVLDNGMESLVFACPTSMLSTYQPIFRLITMLVLRHCESEFHEDDERTTCILIDEAARIGKVEDLPDLMATGRKFHVNIVLFFQDLSQFRYIYKKELAEVILNLCEAKIFLSGAGDDYTTNWLSGIVGEYVAEKVSYQKNGMLNGSSDHKYSTEHRDIITAKTMVTLKEKSEAILVYFGRYMRFKKFMYFNDKILGPIYLDIKKYNQKFKEDKNYG